MARIQGNVYKAAPPTLPTKGTDNIDTKTKRLVVILCYSISFYNTLSRSDFGIGGVVANTTPVITLIEEVSLSVQISKQEFDPSGYVSFD